LKDKKAEMRKLALLKVTDQDILGEIALKDKNSEIRKLALSRIKIE